MSQPTVSEFLREKMMNMARWIHTEVTDSEVNLEHFVETRSNAELVYLAECIKEADPKSFSDIYSISEAPDKFKRVIMFVEEKPDMHDKFWRYVDLFVKTISN